MGKKHTFLQILVLSTATVAALMIAVGAIYEASASWKPTDLQTDGRPRIGRLEAKIEMVVIEDFRCGACRFFTEKIFPHIQSDYIDTGKAFCIVVPVSFLEGSKPLANASLAVYKIAPDRFVSFWHAIFNQFYGRRSNGMEQKEILEIAEKIGGIDLKKMREYVESNAFYPQLDQNLDWAKRIMGNDFGTPALYVNGIRTSTSSVESIQERMEKLERER